MANSSRKCLCIIDEHQQKGTCLSDMPDAMLLEILSHLPTIEAIKTSVLAKRWRYLWTLLPVLRFITRESYLSSDKASEIILKQINFALIFNRSKNLSKFIVSCPSIHFQSSEIYLWCRVAVERQVDELRLEISEPRYSLPASLCRHGSLKSLIMWECWMELPRNSINWPLLRNLELRRSVLADGFYEAIISGCPLLESLVLKRVTGNAGTSLITAPMLRKLSVIDSSVQLKISAPNLESLKISCNQNYFEHTIEDAHSLARVSFFIKMNRSAGYPRGWGVSCGKSLSILLRNASRARFLAICSCCIQIFSARELNYQEPYRLNARYLALKTSFFDSEIPWLQNLLSSSPYLEKISVMIKYRHPCCMKGVVKVGSNFDGSRYMEPRSTQFLHLRDVQIHGIVDINVIAQYDFDEIFEWINILNAQSSKKSRQKIEKKIPIACSKLQKPVVHVLRFVKFLLGSSAGLNSITIWLPIELLGPQHSDYNDSIKNIFIWNCSSIGAAEPRIKFDYEQGKHHPTKPRGFRRRIPSA